MATTTRSRPRSEPSRETTERGQRQRMEARRARPGPRRSEDAESVDEALEIERETGRREGARSRSQRPVTRYGPAGAPRADAPPEPSTPSGPPSIPAGTLPNLTAPLIFETLIITVDEFVNNHRPPLPSRLLVAWGAFTALSLARGQASRAATVFAWGLVVSTFYATVAGQDQPAGLTTLQGLGDFISGTSTKPAGTLPGSTNGTGTPAPSEAGPSGAGSSLPVGGGHVIS